MARLAITLACGDYDRTRALADGRVTVEGADLTVAFTQARDLAFSGLDETAALPYVQVTP
jgi:hypothetical protein